MSEAAGPVETAFLSDGGQPAGAVSERLLGFLAAATRSLEIAIYDLNLDPTEGAALLAGLAAAQARGVAVRLVYNQDHPGPRPGQSPPGLIDLDLLHRLPVEHRAVPGVPDLMHHKYVVRDAGTPAGAVWTGSTNWTADSWTREENVIVTVACPPLAEMYRRNFEELWLDRDVARSGHEAPAWSELGDGGARVRAYFNPGRAPKLVHEVAQRIATARSRIRICSPVLTSGPILASLAEVLEVRPEIVAGCYDRTQMEEVLAQWSAGSPPSWKIPIWEHVRGAVAWGSKRSTPYSAGSIHDFMHAKVVVCDDTVLVGSFNLSHSGERNAENVLELVSPALADRFAAFVEAVAARYRPAPPGLAATPTSTSRPGRRVPSGA